MDISPLARSHDRLAKALDESIKIHKWGGLENGERRIAAGAPGPKNKSQGRKDHQPAGNIAQ
jgi:hypothetical protein